MIYRNTLAGYALSFVTIVATSLLRQPDRVQTPAMYALQNEYRKEMKDEDGLFFICMNAVPPLVKHLKENATLRDCAYQQHERDMLKDVQFSQDRLQVQYPGLTESEVKSFKQRYDTDKKEIWTDIREYIDAKQRMIDILLRSKEHRHNT